ncbi:MAG: CARDB domain-containing protein [Mariprofundaceae bacterium]|nr:CARDB domain-containing protein [Mariprofundaceae bacterium]
MGRPPLGGGTTGTILAEAEVIWKGGPDLVVPFFMPPLIKSQGGKAVFITDVTANTGNLASPASTTRYYLSDSKTVDPNIATVVGERLVDPLQPGQSSGANTLKFTIPVGLQAGTYYMAACADADQGVAELNEDNNCSFNQLQTSTSMVVPLETVLDVTPPVVTAPADISIEAAAILTPVSLGVAVAIDAKDGPLTATADKTGPFALGTHVVTWSATDAAGNTGTATQIVTVVDTTPPKVIAQLIPVDVEEDEGTFRVVFSATDIVDPNPVISATLNGTAVSNGQIVELNRDEDMEVTFEHGKLKIKGMTFELSVTATDASGNAATASATFSFRSERDDDKTSHGEESHES